MTAIAWQGTVSGVVQGVGFRRWTEDEAVRLGLAGWVRNRPDGQVEVLLEGHEASVRKMADELRRGPEAAVVRDVTLAPVEPQGVVGFEIRR